MRGLMRLNRRRRNLVVAAALVSGLILFVAGALADAGNPILGTIKGTAVDNGDGTLTIYVRGQWNWLSHGNDCNDDRNGAGVAIIWDDSTEPGYQVTKGAISAKVGIASLRAGDTVNQVDRMVHPSDRGNLVEGYTVAGTDYPAGQQFVDPPPAGVITAAQVAAWRSGCGRLPLSATASKGTHPERTGKTCGDGTAACSGHPWGSWGYEKNGGLGYAHTYLKSALPNRVCVNFYDVHGHNAGLEAPNGTKEIDADGDSGGNGDNSIQTNSFDVSTGANCLSVGTPTVSTVIHNSAHQVVTTVEAGQTVHDAVTVSGPATGHVTFDWFTNNTCTGAPAATSGNVPLDANGQADATGFAQGPLSVGLYGFKAHYPGDGLFLAAEGPCEPLRVVDANIQITPQSATNPISTNHVLTGHVNVNDGSGLTNAPNGTTISFAILSGPGGFVGASSCTTSGGTGSCTVTISSSTIGTTTIRASTDVNVGGITLHRASGDGKAGDSLDATKLWAKAKIAIAPSATNEVGQSHTFTVTLSKDTGAGYVAAAGEHVDFTLTDSNGATHGAPGGTCTNAGANTNASGQCTITFVSNTAGKVTGHASATLIGNLHVETDGTADNSGDAVKTFVDANIQITPQSATNPISTNHMLTGHVNVNTGAGGYVNAPNGTTITFAIVSGPGSFVGASSCTTFGGTGSCSAVISSSATGTTTIRASTDVTVGGVPLHRESGDGKAGDSTNASKAWAAAKIAIAPSATNEVGQSHTFTVTLSKDTGTGTFVPAAGEHVNFTLTDSNGAVHSAASGSCTNAGANTDASGQCTITFSSATPGRVTAHASATLSINGAAPITVATDGTGSNGSDAVKTFVDANIQLTPPSAINPVSTNHVLTAHVNVNSGSGFASAPDGTQISFTVVSGPGSFTTANPCTTSGGTGSCTITLTSGTAGTTIVSAKVTLSVGGLLVTRSTTGTAGNSGNATKLFADATARTDILGAANNVVTTVVSGTVVHDMVFVAKTAATPAAAPAPTGNVIFHRYATIDCTGTATNETVPLTPGSPSTATSDAFAPTGNISYQAEYLGDANYPARTGACEPLTVTPVSNPAIAIVKNPKSQTVANGGTATFTITVTNSGNTVLTNVTVTDPLSPNCNRTKAQIPALASMAPGASVSYTCTRPNVTASFDNVATAIGTPPTGPNVTASDTAPVKAAALTPAKKKVVQKKKKPKVVSHKKPKATG